MHRKGRDMLAYMLWYTLYMRVFISKCSLADKSLCGQIAIGGMLTSVLVELRCARLLGPKPKGIEISEEQCLQ